MQAPEASGYGFGSSMVVGGLALLPSGLCMLVLAPVAARLVAVRGGGRTTVVGAGTGIGYAAMPALIDAHTPRTEIAAGNGLDSLFRAVGSSLASAVGGSILAAGTLSRGAFELPWLTAYRELFGLCAGAAVLAAVAALAIPHRRPAES